MTTKTLAIIFSLAIGMASRKACSSAFPKYRRPGRSSL
jgi:hypothetical protein